LFVNKTLCIANRYYPIILITYFTTPKNFDIDNLCGPSKKRPPPNGYYLKKRNNQPTPVCTLHLPRKEKSAISGTVVRQQDDSLATAFGIEMVARNERRNAVEENVHRRNWRAKR
jgi:hypothetical protein